MIMRLLLWFKRHARIPPFVQLGHNTGGCAPSQMLDRPLFWIVSLTKRRASTRPALASDVHSVLGRPARRTAGLVAESVRPPVFTTGLQHSVSRVPAGRRTPTGIRSHEIQSHCVKVHSRSGNEELKIASGL